MARSALNAARGIGSQLVPAPPNTLSKLYWSVALPRMAYGLEVVPVNKTTLFTMEHAHLRHAKQIQGLPANTHKPAALATLGWISISGYIDIRKIMFLWHLLSMANGNIYQIVAKAVISKCENTTSEVMNKWSPIRDMYSSVCKYKLDRLLLSNISRGSWGDKTTSKGFIKHVIWTHEIRRWKASAPCYAELKLYYEILDTIKFNVWWHFGSLRPHQLNNISSVLAVLMGGQPKRLQRNFDSNKCQLCHDPRDHEDSPHILFVCPALHNSRVRCTSSLLTGMPIAMREQFEAASARDKASLLLSGFGGTFIAEWVELFSAAASYVHNMYKERAALYDEMMNHR